MRWIALAVAWLVSTAVLAQAYPSKPIRLIAPFPPGGSTDVLCRMLGQKLAELGGQPVVVENRPGAGGVVGHEYAAKQPADGYTLLLTGVSGLSISPHLYKRLGYDPEKDFSPVSMVASAGHVVVVNPSVPAKDLRELIALAKARPGTLFYGSGGKAAYVASASFMRSAGIDTVHVPYKGNGQAVGDLVTGQIQLMVTDLVPTLPHIRSGKLRALAVTDPRRVAALPSIPTVDEAGLPGFRSGGWWAVVLPAGAPAPVVARLNADLARIVQMQDVQARYAELGLFAESGTPQALAERMRADSAEYARLIQAARIDPE